MEIAAKQETFVHQWDTVSAMIEDITIVEDAQIIPGSIQAARSGAWAIQMVCDKSMHCGQGNTC